MLFTAGQVAELMDRLLAEYDYKFRAEYSQMAHDRIQERFEFLSEFYREIELNKYGPGILN